MATAEMAAEMVVGAMVATDEAVVMVVAMEEMATEAERAKVVMVEGRQG